jgi:DNA-binding winged helix-turn-helix (wHTH) protein/tetratricopeptide (TPR) repeat protein
VTVFTFADFELDVEELELRQDGCRVAIRRKPLEVLTYFVRNPGRLISTPELLQRVWGVRSMSRSTVPTSIAVIRRALSDNAKRPRFLETVGSNGYRFLPEVALVSRSTDDSQRSDRPLFVGRTQELRRLHSAIRDASQDGPLLLMITGAPGIGKTRLIEEFIPMAGHTGSRVLTARCREQSGAPALWPWVQILRDYLRSPDIDSASEAAVQAILERIAPQSPDTPSPAFDFSPVPAARARFSLFDSIATLLREPSDTTPLVLIFDDLDRADVTSLLLLEFVLLELRGAALLVVASLRNLANPRDPRAAEILARLATAFETVPALLPGLSYEAVAELINQIELPSSDYESLARALHERSGGNPFFIQQLVQLLGAGGPDEPRTGGLPDGVREAIRRHVDTLSASTKMILEAAAISGREFSAAVVSSTLHLPANAVLAAIDDALAAQLIEPLIDRPGYWRFAHTLLRDALYEQLPLAMRSALHLSTAEALEASHSPHPHPYAAEIAHHFLRAVDTGGANGAMTYSVMAAEWATSRLAYEEAPNHYRKALHALELSDANTTAARCRILLALGRSELAAGEREIGRETIRRVADLARSSGDAEHLALAALSLAPGPLALEVGVYDGLLVSLLEEAVRLCPRSPSVLRAQLMSRLSLALVWSSSEARRFELARQGHRTARSTRDQSTIAYSLLAQHGVLAGPNHLAERLRIAEEMSELSVESKDPILPLMHRILRITDLLEKGEINAVDQEIHLFTQQAHATRHPYVNWYASLFASMRALMSGRFATSMELAQEFKALGTLIDDQNAIQSFGGHQVLHLWKNARIVEAVALVEQLVARFPTVPGWRSTLAFVYAESGRLNDAQRQVDLLAEQGFEAIPRNEIWSVTIATLAHAAATIGDTGRCRDLYSLLRGPEHPSTTSSCLASEWPVSVRQRGTLLSWRWVSRVGKRPMSFSRSQPIRTGESVPYRG